MGLGLGLGVAAMANMRSNQSAQAPQESVQRSPPPRASTGGPGPSPLDSRPLASQSTQQYGLSPWKEGAFAALDQKSRAPADVMGGGGGLGSGGSQVPTPLMDVRPSGARMSGGGGGAPKMGGEAPSFAESVIRVKAQWDPNRMELEVVWMLVSLAMLV